jgi:dipeptidase E
MKLYLSSIGIPNPQSFKALFDKPKINLGLIANAWDTTPAEKSQPFIESTAHELMALGIEVWQIDLRQYVGKAEELKTALAGLDGIWVMGGNSFYLNHLTLQVGLGGILNELFPKGFVYGGESAGAVIAGTTLHGIEFLDNPKDAPATLWQGLCLIGVGLIPHWGNKKYETPLRKCLEEMKHHNTPIITLHDDQYLVMSGQDLQVLRG